jgi:hypothetical protein
LLSRCVSDSYWLFTLIAILQRPVWESPNSSSPTVLGNTGFGSLTQAGSVNALLGDGGADVPLTPEPDTTWPSATELVVVPGTSKVTLSIQCPLLRAVLQDAFENIRISLLFINAFPDAAAIPTVIRTALITSAKSHNRASDILKRLLRDENYMASMARLVSHNFKFDVTMVTDTFDSHGRGSLSSEGKSKSAASQSYGPHF